MSTVFSIAFTIDAADYTGDGKVTEKDIGAIKRAIASVDVVLF